MCGILALYSADSASSVKEFKSALDKISHRGPDDFGILTASLTSDSIQLISNLEASDESQVMLGHRRLSIIDLSTGAQPMIDESGNFALVFNGEIFNYRQLRDELIHKYKLRFYTTSDTEVLLKGLILEGDDFLHRCNGMWAFAFYDLEKKNLLLSRDRFGIKPLFFYTDNRQIIFSSEIKPLFVYNQAVCDEEMLDFFTRTGLSDFSERTFFSGINQVKQGENVIVSAQNSKLHIQKKTWYELKEQKIVSPDLNQVLKQLHDLVLDAVRIRLESDVEVGSLLSGGIDSSIVVSAAALHNKNFKTFSGISSNPDYDESYWINKLVDSNPEVKNYRINLEEDVTAEEIDNVIRAQESPFSGSSILSQNRLFKSISSHKLKVILDGQGSDEINLGYDKYFAYAMKEILKDRKYSLAGQYVKDMFSYQSVKHGILHCFDALVSPAISDYFRRKAGHSSLKEINEMIYLSKNMKLFDFEKLLHQKMLLPIHLRYLDRNSMNYSIEARSPFLDHRLVEFSLSIPAHLRLYGGRRKGLLLESMKEMLPNEIYTRRNKIGFKSDDRIILNRLDSSSTSFREYTTKRWRQLFFQQG